MKKQFLVTALSCLFIGSIIVSCKKDDKDDDETGTTTTSTTSTTSTTGQQNNPLVTKECTGVANIEIDGQKTTMNSMEKILPPLNFYGVYSSGGDNSFTILNGSKKLPDASKTFTVQGDQSKIPDASQVIITYYDDATQQDFHATDGIVTYTISTSEKTMKFQNIVFKTEDNALSKTISFEVKLK